MNEEDIFRDYLRRKGLKFTPERRIILDEVFSIHAHFDVEDLFQGLYQRNERISRATIYRTLPLLIDSGLIREAMRRQDRVYYEHTYGHRHHDHMICIKCGKIIEFRDDRIERLQEEICKKHGFKPIEHRLGIRGYCKDCQ
ncbi:MAG TPA: transcriptional repressor [bacterium (Candidatus Stahlbacteria)]|nr:transcriptional repressor [Candidatus Stahlbacteria bacterium]